MCCKDDPQSSQTSHSGKEKFTYVNSQFFQQFWMVVTISSVVNLSVMYGGLISCYAGFPHLLRLSMFDGPLILLMNLAVFDTIHQ